MAPSTAASQAFGRGIRRLLGLVMGPSNHTLFPFIPGPVKLFVALVFFLNWKSWPLMWHFQVLKPVVLIKLKELLNFKRKRQWIERLPKAGTNPFDVLLVSKRYASLDDCDFNMHLSNSAYSKNVDTTRTQAACDIFGPLLCEGVWVALAGSQFSFIREIPVGTHYEIRTTCGGWGEKWFYMVNTFVSYPTSKKAKPVINSLVAGPSTPSLLYTPPRSQSPAPGTLSPDLKVVNKALLEVPRLNVGPRRIPLPGEPVVHCVAVSLYCFKIGRITIPPSVLFVAGGFGDPSRQRWSRVQDLRFSEKGNRIPEMLKGGWKTDQVEGWPQSSREPWSSFWDLDEFEQKRVDAMENTFRNFQSSWEILKDFVV